MNMTLMQYAVAADRIFGGKTDGSLEAVTILNSIMTDGGVTYDPPVREGEEKDSGN